MALTHAWHDLVHDMRDEAHDLATISRASAARQAYLALWVTFMALPLLLGLDKLVAMFSSTWEGYLATWVDDLLPGTAATAMIWFGVIEIALAVLVFAVPRIGADLLALWFGLTAINLFSIAEINETGLLAAALAICCLALARLSTMFHHRDG